MDSKYVFDNITRKTFDDLLAQYRAVLPEKLTQLDVERYETIPETVKRRKEARDAHLTKDEVLTLVKWKVSHGRFRPTLMKLCKENAEGTVEAITRNAFKSYSSPSVESAKTALATLTQLRGIGPATASLLLSVYEPDTAPFFAVGIFGWATKKKGRGREWEQGIKYNIKEYIELFTRVQTFCKRLQVSALDAEKVGYVIGKTNVGSPAATTGEKRKAVVDVTTERAEDPKDEELEKVNQDAKPSIRSSKRRKQAA